MVDWEDFTKRFQALPSVFPSEDDDLMHTYEGIKFLKVTPPNSLREIKELEVRQDDLFLISYPKAGTTWMQQIISMILSASECIEHNDDIVANTGSSRKEEQKINSDDITTNTGYSGKEEKKFNDCNDDIASTGGSSGKDEQKVDDRTHLFFRFPFLEMNWVKHYSQLALLPPTHKLIDKMSSPRNIKTHLPAAMLPRQLYEKSPKIIYIARNPKDIAVSYYHMHQKDITLQTYKDWKSFIQDFMDGNIQYGSCFDHTLFWWKRCRDKNVLFMKYEDMIQDQNGSILRIADFLGRHHLTATMVDNIAQESSFTYMKQNPDCNPDTLGFMDTDSSAAGNNQTERRSDEPPSMFMRKGIIGDWKNYFSDDDNVRFDAIFKAKTEGTGLTFDF